MNSLLDDLEEETGGLFLELIRMLFLPLHEYSADLIYYSISNVRSNRNTYSVAVEIIASSTVQVEGIFGRMLQMLIRFPRKTEVCSLDLSLIEQQVELLLSLKDITNLTSDLALFETIFVRSSWDHLAAVINRFDTRSDNGNMETMIRETKKMNIRIKLLLLTIVQISRNKQLFFAEELHNAIHTSPPDHASIIRIIVTRSEVYYCPIVEIEPLVDLSQHKRLQ
ncbi:unnamed protein product [Dracunculus medinensis]|uniref:Protein MAK10 homolog n=1 Tax=Dracunculus medinensis TaxID=318479 RepID=A0A0N4U484_DRAME|nr:unnamed protein product [Dracunculus medinensis]